MELSTDLVIKIVVLLTAIVGLYKTANIEAAKPFLVQILAAMSVLAMPATRRVLGIGAAIYAIAKRQ
jgi:hypothetical protein